eukprot:jgi/Tetstr1/458927/TSEL_000391.t1
MLRGWGGVLNGGLEARGFWRSAGERRHITLKELKAMLAELRRLWCLLDSHGIHLRAWHIRSAANIWADRLSRHLDSDDWQLDPLLFAEPESRFGPHSIDRFASALNTMLPRYNAAWLDPTCEAVDSLHLPDADWRRENNWCNAPWPLLPDLVQKPQQSGAAATVVALRWEGKAWHHALTEMAVEELTPYLSAVNNFFKDHGREPMALGDLVSRVRKGLAASQVTRNPELMRPPLPARVVLKALTWQTPYGWSWDLHGARTQVPWCVELFRASLTIVVLCLFFCRGGAGVECRTGDLTVGPDGGILLYHRDRKGQRCADASKKLLCQLPPSAHADITAMLHYFDAARHVFAGVRMLAARWAINRRESQAKWTADTLTSWLAATAAYVIGVTMQKIKYFGGWAMESNVVLNYIYFDPTVLPCEALLAELDAEAAAESAPECPVSRRTDDCRAFLRSDSEFDKTFQAELCFGQPGLEDEADTLDFLRTSLPASPDIVGRSRKACPVVWSSPADLLATRLRFRLGRCSANPAHAKPGVPLGMLLNQLQPLPEDDAFYSPHSSPASKGKSPAPSSNFPTPGHSPNCPAEQKYATAYGHQGEASPTLEQPVSDLIRAPDQSAATAIPSPIWSFAKKSAWDIDASMVLTGVSMALPGPSSPCALDIEVAGGDQQRAPDPCVSPEPEKMQSILEDANALAKSLETGHFGKAPVQLADAASAAQSNCFSLGAASPGHFRGSIGGAGRSLKNSSKLRAPKSSFHFFNGASTSKAIDGRPSLAGQPVKSIAEICQVPTPLQFKSRGTASVDAITPAAAPTDVRPHELFGGAASCPTFMAAAESMCSTAATVWTFPTHPLESAASSDAAAPGDRCPRPKSTRKVQGPQN